MTCRAQDGSNRRSSPKHSRPALRAPPIAGSRKPKGGEDQMATDQKDAPAEATEAPKGKGKEKADPNAEEIAAKEAADKLKGERLEEVAKLAQEQRAAYLDMLDAAGDALDAGATPKEVEARVGQYTGLTARRITAYVKERKA